MHYRSLFDELLEADDGQADITARGQTGRTTGHDDSDAAGLDRHDDGEAAAGAPGDADLGYARISSWPAEP